MAAELSADELKFVQAKAALMQSNQDGESAYDHLVAIIQEITESNPNDVAHHPEKLAALSAQLKTHKFVIGDNTNAANTPAVTHHTQIAAAAKNKALFVQEAPEVKTVVEKPTPYTTVTTTTVVPKAAPQFKSVVADNIMWKHCGVGLPDQEAFLLDQSVSRLASKRSLEEVRFVGKIFGLSSNYIVISSKRFVPENESVYEEVYAMPKPPRKKVEVDMQREPGFKGCNRLSFWVTPDANSEWTLLPDVTPQEINAARQVRKFMTGDLKATVNAHPAFVGSEAVYLRAQLARIVSATYITPTGVLEKVEPEDEEEAEEEEDGKAKGPKPAKYYPLTKLNKEFEGETTVALADPEQWVHSDGYIYENGRQTKIPEKPETEEEEVEAEDEEEDETEKKEEEERELFLPIKKDSSYAIIHLPKEPSPEDEDEEAEAEADPAEGEEGEDKEEEDEKEEDEDEIADDDPLKKKIPAWTTRLTNTVYKNHAVVVVRSLRWPGAVAYAAQKGKSFGAVYFGWGCKKTDISFTPAAASEIVKEAEDIIEMADPTAGNEKLVMRGEDPKEADSEDEKEDDEDEEADDQ